MPDLGRDKRLSDSEMKSQRIKAKEHCLADLFNRQEVVTPERLQDGIAETRDRFHKRLSDSEMECRD